ncbi:MAG TPA: hypothetical protein VK846_04385 [Candidatus Limnocylindria bacterium]|nr:hypothetical protein [Candidatus Limnocylindria bacterium]
MLFITSMKAILSIVVAVCVLTPAVFAGENKACDQAKACCAEKAKGTECTSAKKSCPKEAALRQALLKHKGATLAQR